MACKLLDSHGRCCADDEEMYCHYLESDSQDKCIDYEETNEEKDKHAY